MKKIIITCLFILSSNLFALIPTTKSEQEGLNWLREYTKLSQDVYHDIYLIWDVDIFKSIEYLEGKDLLLIDELIDDYNLTNPTKDLAKGEYQSQYITRLYKEFSSKYEKSEYEAIRIAATIEDLMISDLNELLKYSTNRDFINIFTKIRYSAISHIRAVNNYMKKIYYDEYHSQFLSSKELKDILIN